MIHFNLNRELIRLKDKFHFKHTSKINNKILYTVGREFEKFNRNSSNAWKYQGRAFR